MNAASIAQIQADLQQQAQRLLTCQDDTWQVVPGVSAMLRFHEYDETVDHLFHDWLNAVDFVSKRHALFAGELQNKTEAQFVWHTQSRALQQNHTESPAITALRDSYQAMVRFANNIQSLSAEFSQFEAITDIIHIGIGGSVFGPMLVEEALGNEAAVTRTTHYVSYMDENVMTRLLSRVNPKTSLVILVSKSFKTEEMLFQANVIKHWFNAANCPLTQHVMAVTAQPERAVTWGVNPALILGFPAAIGGRFSLWSAVGLSNMLSLGQAQFEQLHQGAWVMDQHFLKASFSQNLPIRLACLSAWYTQFKAYHAHAVIPYNARLVSLPLYLQQMHMESLGKSLDEQQQAIQQLACPVIFGDIGTRSQHALSQYFMQSPTVVPLDIITIQQQVSDSDKRLQAHALAQANVLWQGYEAKEQAYRSIRGRRPSTTIRLDKLDAYHLGALLALYEHKVFTLACLYRINAFDQWGVERGKTIARSYYEA